MPRTLGSGYTEGYGHGRNAAQKESVNLFGFGSLGASCAFGAPGCIGVTVAGFLMEEPPRQMETHWSPEYRDGYRQGYSQRLKERRGRAALIGGAVGIIPSLLLTIVILVIWFDLFATASNDSSSAANAFRHRSILPPSGFQIGF